MLENKGQQHVAVFRRVNGLVYLGIRKLDTREVPTSGSLEIIGV